MGVAEQTKKYFATDKKPNFFPQKQDPHKWPTKKHEMITMKSLSTEVPGENN